jgi:cell wall-associated NlpC family hydrolase
MKKNKKSVTQLKREQIVSVAKKWVGTPFHHRARILQNGVDCANYLVAVYHEVGLVEDLDLGLYPHDWHLHRDEERFVEWLDKYADTVPFPRLGDVILMQFGRTYSHGAIYIDNNQIIHSYVGHGVSVGDLSDFFDRKKLFYRIKGL